MRAPLKTALASWAPSINIIIIIIIIIIISISIIIIINIIIISIISIIISNGKCSTVKAYWQGKGLTSATL